MSIAIIYTFASVIAVSVVSLIGVVALSFRDSILKKCISFLVALAIGALLGDAFIHLIPEALEKGDPSRVSLLIIVGIFIFFALEKFFNWHHGIHDEEHGHDPAARNINPLGRMIIISDSLHNFLDGIIIAASYLVSIEVGIASTIAIILHEIPQEIADFGVLIHAGYTKARALLLNFLSAALAIVGALFVLVFGAIAQDFVHLILPLAAGSFIYIASSDLTPELHKETRAHSTFVQFIAIFIGIAAMYFLLFFEI